MKAPCHDVNRPADQWAGPAAGVSIRRPRYPTVGPRTSVLRVLAATLLLTVLVLGQAQTLTFGSGLVFAPGGLHAEPSLVLSDLDLGRLEFSARAAGLAAGPLELGVGARTSFSYGPIGTIQLEGQADADTAGAFRVALRGSGVITNVAASARLRVFNVAAGRFELAEAYTIGTPLRSPAGRFGAALELSGSYRLARTTILTAAPGLRFVAGEGLGAHLASELQLRGMVERDDGLLMLMADLAPDGEAYAAAGFAYALNRRGMPVTRASLWLGGGSRGIYPGFRLEFRESIEGREPGFGLELAAEPYRHDVLPFRSRGFVTVPLAGGELGFETLIGYDPEGRLPPFSIGLHHSLSF